MERSWQKNAGLNFRGCRKKLFLFGMFVFYVENSQKGTTETVNFILVRS